MTLKDPLGMANIYGTEEGTAKVGGVSSMSDYQGNDSEIIASWWFGTFLMLGVIIPTDVHIFQRGGSTPNQVVNYISSVVLLTQHGYGWGLRVYKPTN